MREELSQSIKELIAAAAKRGYITPDALNGAMPADDYTYEEIKDVVALLSSRGINITGVMELYTVVWKRDDEEIFRLHTHAADEAEAIARGHACFADHPELFMGHNLEGTTVEVGYGSTSPRPYDPGVRQQPSVTCWQEKDQKRLEDLFAALSQNPHPPS